MVKIDRITQRKIEDWLASHKELIATTKPTLEKLAKIISDEIGTTINAHNVKAAAKTMEIQLPRPQRTYKNDVVVLAEDFVELSEIMIDMASNLSYPIKPHFIDRIKMLKLEIEAKNK